MDVREKLIQILSVPIYPHLDADPAEVVADYLLDNGITITPAVPGPEIADPNIMELCFRNGERHMKEKVITKLKDISAEIMFENRISGEVTVVNFEHVIRILEDL